jgi:hypothetical protein
VTVGVDLITHRWGAPVLLALSLLVPALAGADQPSNEARPASASNAFREGLLLDSFGKWQIRKGLLDHTYLLIGESSGKSEGYFWLHCDQNRLMTVAVPLAERTGHERLRSHAVVIRADTGATRSLDLMVFESFVAVAMDFDGGRNAKVSDFIEVLRAAKEKVTISYAHRTFEYDVTQLPAAETRFQQLCNRTASY